MQLKNAKQTNEHANMQLMISKCHRPVVGLALAALALMSLSRPALAEAQLQIKGQEAGAVSLVSFQFPFSHQSIAAQGRASHFGNYTLTVNFAVDVRAGTTTGVGTLTAANGDMLFLDQVGHLVANSNFLKTTGTYTITGGSGRFQGATGTITSDFTFGIAVNAGVFPNPYTGVVTGTIILAEQDEQ
jgi:hypothetical protein